MEDDKIILVYRGYWDGSEYKNGEEELVFAPLRTISFEEFLDVVHDSVKADRRLCNYVLHCLVPTEDCGAIKSKIKSERELRRVANLFRTPKIFVTIEPKHHDAAAPSFYGSQSIRLPGHQDMRQHGFVQLMTSQGTYGNQFSYDSQYAVGHQFQTGYGMNYMNWPSPYLVASQIHRAEPSSTPYLVAPQIHRVEPSSIPYLSAPHIHRAEPNSIPDLPTPHMGGAGPSSTPIVDEPELNLGAILEESRRKSTLVADQSYIPRSKLDGLPVENQYERSNDCDLDGDMSYNNDNISSDGGEGDGDGDGDVDGDGGDDIDGGGGGGYNYDDAEHDDDGSGDNVDTTDNDEDEDFEAELTRRLIYDDYGWEYDDYFVPENIENDSPYDDIGGGVGDHEQRVLRGRNITIQRRNTCQMLNTVDGGEGDSFNVELGDEMVDVRRHDWIIPGASFHSSDIIPTTTPGPGDLDQELYIGATFESKEQLINTVGFYHMKNWVSCRTQRSSKTRYSVVCTQQECPFMLRSTRSQGRGWRVIKFVGEHTCQLDMGIHPPRQISSKVIGAWFAPNLLQERRVLKPRDIQADLSIKYEIDILYDKALKAQHRAQSLIYGDHEKSWELLLSYLYLLKKRKSRIHNSI